MGNSEVGHLNIGAGRVVEQWLLRISRALRGSYLNESPEYQQFVKANKDSTTVHVVGLYSTGGVHSHAEHLQLLLARLAHDLPHHTIALHLISDGRDVSPTAFSADLEELLLFLKGIPRAQVRSICGRFFAMDRDKRWERVQSAYDAIALGKGLPIGDPMTFVQESYARGTTDEFIEPGVVGSTPIAASDSVIFFNFREDRMREIVGALCAPEFEGFSRSAPVPQTDKVLCFTEYDHSFHLPFLFSQIEIKNHLGELVAAAGVPQLRVAETEKYPHVTYFFNGGIEKAYQGEERKLVPSPRDVKTYDQKPEMSALGVTELVRDGLRSGLYGFIVVNFANCDMVGHTGVLEAGIKAVETVDTCLGQILTTLKEVGGQALIIADHGNAEQMISYVDGTPHTAHTTYPVPVILVDYERPVSLRPDGALCDVAPTLVKMMKLTQPAEMTGTPLFS
jgi:2,3-bisphosphoglycerate-independent phosphoglycerate mutase